MKKKLLMILLLIPTFIYAQDPATIIGILGVEFGTTKEYVILKMKEKGATISLSEDDAVYFLHVKFGVFEGCTASFFFLENKLYQGQLILPVVIEANLIDQYKKVNAELAKKYGAGDEYEEYKYPFAKGDGLEITAIKLGKATVKSYWTKNKNNISTQILKDMFVLVTYQDRILINEAIKLQDKKSLIDY